MYKTGSTGKITADLHNALKKKGIESVVCYGRGPKINEPNVYKTCSEVYSKFNNLISRFMHDVHERSNVQNPLE